MMNFIRILPVLSLCCSMFLGAMACDETYNMVEDLLSSSWTQWLLKRNCKERHSVKLFDAVSSDPFLYFMSIDRTALKISYQEFQSSGTGASSEGLVTKEKIIFSNDGFGDDQLALLPLLWCEHAESQAKPLITADKLRAVRVDDGHIVTVRDTETDALVAQCICKADCFLSLIGVALDAVTILFNDQQGNIFAWNYTTNTIHLLYKMDDCWDRAYVIPRYERWYIITERKLANTAGITHYQSAVTEIVPGDYLEQLLVSLNSDQINLLEKIFDGATRGIKVKLHCQQEDGVTMYDHYQTLPYEIRRLVKPFVLIPDLFDDYVRTSDASPGWLSSWCSIV
jgi:hypothetical protein